MPLIEIILLNTRDKSCKFKYCYNKCVKRFFGYNKYDSATAVFMELKLFKACWQNHSNSIVSLIPDVYRPIHHCLNVCECVLVPVCCFCVSMYSCGL